MRSVCALALALTFSMIATGALAGLDKQTIAQAGLALRPGAQLPLEAHVDEAGTQTTLGAVLEGKPALLLFVDYRCRSLCGVVLDQLADVLPSVSLRLGQAYNVVTIALDDAQTQNDALAFRDRHIGGTALAAHGRFLTEDAAARKAIEASVGLVAPFDDEHRQFAHPAAVIAVDAAGRATQIMSPFAFDGLDLTLALSGSGTKRSFGTALLHLCYGWDPVVGRYTVRIERLLAVLAGVTVLLLFGTVAAMLVLERRRARKTTSDNIVDRQEPLPVK